jgi:hypothetical protein
MSEDTVGAAGAVYLAVSMVLIAFSVRRGRGVFEQLALRHPEHYEALGRPRPGFFDSPRRTRFAQYLSRREYLDLPDPPLVEELEALRRFEHRMMAALLIGLAALGLAIAYVRYA